MQIGACSESAEREQTRRKSRLHGACIFFVKITGGCPRDHVVPQVHPFAEELPDLLDRRVHLLSRPLVLLLAAGIPAAGSLLSFLLLIVLVVHVVIVIVF